MEGLKVPQVTANKMVHCQVAVIRSFSELCVLKGHYLVKVYGLLLPNEWVSIICMNLSRAMCPFGSDLTLALKRHHPCRMANVKTTYTDTDFKETETKANICKNSLQCPL